MSTITIARSGSALRSAVDINQMLSAGTDVQDRDNRDRQVKEDLKAHRHRTSIDALWADFEKWCGESSEDCWQEHWESQETARRIAEEQDEVEILFGDEEEDVEFTETEATPAAVHSLRLVEELRLIETVPVTPIARARRRLRTVMRHKRQARKYGTNKLAELKQHRVEHRLISRTRKQARHIQRPKRRFMGLRLNVLLGRLRSKHPTPGASTTKRHIKRRSRHLAAVTSPPTPSLKELVPFSGEFISAGAQENGDIVVVSRQGDGRVVVHSIHENGDVRCLMQAAS